MASGKLENQAPCPGAFHAPVVLPQDKVTAAVRTYFLYLTIAKAPDLCYKGLMARLNGR